MRIAVMGTGGVGGYFGGRLAEAGVEVTLIARGPHLRTLQQQGLRIESVAGDAHVTNLRATDDPATVGVVDAVLVATKTWQVAEAARRMGPLLGPDTLVVGLQNGVEAAGQLGAVVGSDRVAGGTCRLISMLAGPGHIRHVGNPPWIAIGDLTGTTHERCLGLKHTFDAARGVQFEVHEDVRIAMWQKFLFIASASGVGAAADATLGELRRVPETRKTLERAMAEVARLAETMGVPLGVDAVDRALKFTDSLPAEGTTSMQRDLLNGRPSELEAQSGAVVRLGEQHGVDVPVHRLLHAVLQPRELRARSKP
ncbi:MAG: 2-dehydropantoate 2-reductase [Myxococcota bacterium]